VFLKKVLDDENGRFSTLAPTHQRDVNTIVYVKPSDRDQYYVRLAKSCYMCKHSAIGLKISQLPKQL